MVSTRSTTRLLAAALLAALLAACGGGGGNPGTTTGTSGTGSTGGVTSPTSSVDKYLGTWALCDQVGASESDRTRLTFAKTSETSMTVAATTTTFASADCSGATTGTNTINSTITLAGTKTINGEPVDKINVTNSGGSSKDVLRIRTDGKLYTGSAAGGVDAEGYPTALDPAGFTKE